MREERRHRIEVHVSGVCLRQTGDGTEVLLVKRSPRRKLFPGFWECGGGQVRPGEGFEEALARQLAEELNVRARVMGIVDTFLMETDDPEQRRIPGLRFACSITGFVKGDGPVVSSEHTGWKWADVRMTDRIEIIPGLQGHILKAADIFSDSRRQK
jgi:8-oxo-dGTP diphosphatase